MDITLKISILFIIRIMKIYIIPKLKLIVGFSPKCGCSTIKTLLFRKLDHQIVQSVHIMLTKQNLISGKYDIFDYASYIENNKINHKKFTKIIILRNPYKRLISGLRQRSTALCSMGLGNYNITEYLKYLENNNFGPDANHFEPQSFTGIKTNLLFDIVIDISKIEILYEILGLPYIAERVGQCTNYVDNNENYYNHTFKDFSNKNCYNDNVNNWFTEDNIQSINKLYKQDFEFAKKYGIDYKLL